MAASCCNSTQEDTSGWLRHIMKELDKYRRMALFCDTELQTKDGCHFYGHSSILAASSPILHQQFFQSKPGVYMVKIPINSAVMECILSYIYTGSWDLVYARGVDLPELEDGVQVLGLPQSQDWSWRRKRSQRRPQRCLHGKPKCRKRRSTSISDSLPEAETKEVVSEEDTDNPIPASASSISVESSPAHPPVTSAQLSQSVHSEPTHHSNTPFGSPVSLELTMAGNSPLHISSSGGSLTPSPEQSNVNSIHQEAIAIASVNHRSAFPREVSLVPHAPKRKHARQDRQVFRHVKFTSPVDSSVEESDSMDWENIPPLISSEVRPTVTKVDGHEKLPHAHKGPRPKAFRKILKLEKRSTPEAVVACSRSTPEAVVACSRSVKPREYEQERGGHCTESVSVEQKSSGMVDSVVVLQRLKNPYPSALSTSVDEKRIQKPSHVERVQKPSQVERVQKPSQVERVQKPSQVVRPFCVTTTGERKMATSGGSEDIADEDECSLSSSSSSSGSDDDSSSDDDDSSSLSSDEEVGAEPKAPNTCELVISADRKSASDRNHQGPKSPENQQESTELSPMEAEKAKSSCCTNSKAIMKAAQAGVKFLRQEIQHKWILDEETKESQWYLGKVMAVVSGMDGYSGTVYQVDYKGEGVYDVDHLLEDYLEGSLSIMP